MLNRNKANEVAPIEREESVGKVKMTLEHYNDLMKELTMYRNAVSIRDTNWRNEIDVYINMKAFYDIAKDLVAEEFPMAMMKPKKDLYEISTGIAMLPEEPVQEDIE